MTLGIIGWIVLGTIATVIVMAIVISRMMCPPDLFEAPQDPPPPKPNPPKRGAVDLEEVSKGHWK